MITWLISEVARGPRIGGHVADECGGPRRATHSALRQHAAGLGSGALAFRRSAKTHDSRQKLFVRGRKVQCSGVPRVCYVRRRRRLESSVACCVCSPCRDQGRQVFSKGFNVNFKDFKLAIRKIGVDAHVRKDSSGFSHAHGRIIIRNLMAVSAVFP